MYLPITHGIAASGDLSNVTVSNLNTTGADLILAFGAYNAGTGFSINDTKMNIWNPLTEISDVAGQTCRMFWSRPNYVGSNHSFNGNTSFGFLTMAIAAFSGSKGTPFDQQNGASQSAGATGFSSGLVQPIFLNELIVTGICLFWSSDPTSIDSNFILLDHIAGVPSVNFGCGLAYKIKRDNAPENPLWVWSGSVSPAASIATFQAIEENQIMVGQQFF